MADIPLIDFGSCFFFFFSWIGLTANVFCARQCHRSLPLPVPGVRILALDRLLCFLGFVRELSLIC
jgi:hypothetical protein